MTFRPILLVLLSVCALPHARAQTAARASTPEDRKRVLAIIDDLETNPLGPSATQERNVLATYLLSASDIHVTMCYDLLGDLPKGPNSNNSLLAMQPVFSSTRYAIQHGGGNASSVEQYQAGVLGTLKTYENLVKAKPSARQPLLDSLLKKRDNGTLAAYVKNQVATRCKIKGAK